MRNSKQDGTAAGFTPGPWQNTPMQDTIWDSTGDVQIAKVTDLPWINGKSDWMTEQANARLIASTPALWEACKLAKSLIGDYVNHKPVEMCAFAEAFVELEQALAQAEGQI